MKNILITGAKSYLGTQIKNYLCDTEYNVKTLSVRDDRWKKCDFMMYTSIIHCAAIVHLRRKISEDKFLQINKTLTYDLAKKAKDEGVKQFIFISSMNVYGINSGEITLNTVPEPISFYGKSKLLAERELLKLEDSNFKIVIIRPPMIYGRGCKGNYCSLEKVSKHLVIIPDYHNSRSMLYIANFCEFIKQAVDKELAGLFFPQNREYVCTCDLITKISTLHGNKVIKVKWCNSLISMLIKRSSFCEKLFGNLTYSKDMSQYSDIQYQVADYNESVEFTEGKNNNA